MIVDFGMFVHRARFGCGVKWYPRCSAWNMCADRCSTTNIRAARRLFQAHLKSPQLRVPGETFPSRAIILTVDTCPRAARTFRGHQSQRRRAWAFMVDDIHAGFDR